MQEGGNRKGLDIFGNQTTFPRSAYMFRKLTALFLLGLMMSVSATAQGKLSYCLCLHVLSIGGCPCEVPTDLVPNGEDFTYAGDCPHCECCEEEEAGETFSIPAAGQDCTIEFALEVDPYVWSPHQIATGLNAGSDDDLAGSLLDELIVLSVVDERPSSMRAPPDARLPRPVPLFLWHRILLI